LASKSGNSVFHFSTAANFFLIRFSLPSAARFKLLFSVPLLSIFKMPGKGGGLTKPMKLSPELADVVGKKEASRAECVKQVRTTGSMINLHTMTPLSSCSCGPTSRSTTCRTPRTSSSSSRTRPWPRCLARTSCAAFPCPSTWASTSRTSTEARLFTVKLVRAT